MIIITNIAVSASVYCVIEFKADGDIHYDINVSDLMRSVN